MGRSKAPSLPIKALSFCHPTELRGKGGGASHQRGNLLARRAVGLFSDGRKPGCKGFIQTGAFYNLEAPTSPAERYYITPEGESPQPACKAKPITGRTLAAQGQRPGGWLNPHARKGVSTYGNTGKHRADPDRAERRLNPHARQGVSKGPLPQSKNSSLEKERSFLISWFQVNQLK